MQYGEFKTKFCQLVIIKYNSLHLFFLKLWPTDSSPLGDQFQLMLSLLSIPFVFEWILDG